MLRPQACRWFELVAPRDTLAPVLEALAKAGQVELQARVEAVAPPLVLADAAPLLERFAALARTHAAHWPPPAAGLPSATLADPAAALHDAMARLDAWRDEADPLLAEDERGAARRRGLQDLARVAAAAQRQPNAWPGPALISAAGTCHLGRRLAVGPAATPAADLPADVLRAVLPLDADAATPSQADGAWAALLIGPAATMAAVDARLAAVQARTLPWLPGLDGDWAAATNTIAAAEAGAARAAEARSRALQALATRHRLADALATVNRVAWLVQHGRALAASTRLVWITGWTTAPDADALCAPLRQAGLHGLAQFTPPPDDAEPPSRLANPPWARAFEALAQLLGQPGRDEADPSRLLAVIAPLLFGFMFGDVGQGVVLLLAGLALRRRWPALAMLIPGGMAAIGFGVAFGSVFGREDLIPAAWGHPLAHPVDLLIAAVALGAAILLAGLALNALSAAWRRDLRGWWARDAALVLAYAGALAAPWWPAALAAVAVGALWMALGTAAAAEHRGHRTGGFLRGLAAFIEQALQLAVNTVSFARVGAFALAHAGLSAAITGIADAAGPIGQWPVMVLGNLLVLVLEGLVVGIQTTRLLLFEFFLRFLSGRGRAFRPLAPPPTPHPLSP
ncbi:MAG: hypothetical protein H6932_00350 [Burkholderiaceae bacterium]|nr:hypothetical protein [Burkholderiaceae bacterium]